MVRILTTPQRVAPNADIARLPAIRFAFAPVADLATAEARTRRLAYSHYENFSVVSLLLPARLRQDFCNIYAFCRTADDLGDEVGDRDASLDYLADFKRQTRACFAGQSSSAVFVALSSTIRKYDIPIQPFLDLVDAFEQDQRITRYESFEQLVDYCRRSADPVGRLVLCLCGYRDERRQKLSDKTCTALQLTNFWQDVRRDILDRDRIYIPAESMRRFAVTERQIKEGRCDDNFRRLLQFEVDRTQALFREGEALLPLLDPAFRRHIALFARGGMSILDAIRRRDYDTLSSRPTLSPWRKARLVVSAAGAFIAEALLGGRS